MSYVLLSSPLVSNILDEILLRAARDHTGKPARFLAEDLRYALAGSGDLPAFSHVNNFDKDFTLFVGDTDEFDNMASTLAAKPFPWHEDRKLTLKQPDYSNNNNTAARRSRSPTRDRDNNNNYRDQRSPATNYERTDRRPSRSEQPQGNMEDRQNSQQDRRVYVGNLSYDVKWHHLKDHMREGMLNSPLYHINSLPATNSPHSWSGSLRRRPRAAERNEQG